MIQTQTIEPSKALKMFEFLSEPSLPDVAHNAIVFGRKDGRLADSLVQLQRIGLLGTAVITGGIGKDSGDIRGQGFGSEAEWLKHQAVILGVDPARIIMETRARNGGENARFALGLLSLYGLEVDPITVVAHATSARRLSETVKHESILAGIPIETIYRVPTRYDFDPFFEIDAREAFDEYARLVNWPTRPEGAWLQAQEGLDPNLVDYVQDVTNRNLI